jgi:hypothetical protein
MSIALTAALGTLTGLHAATWGAFKDSPFEGFRMRSFARSIALGSAVGAVLGAASTLDSTESVVVLVGLLYTGERLATEWWKTFLREDPQSKYAIPMRLAVLGRPVDARLPRYLGGAVAALGLLAVGLLVGPQSHDHAPLWADVAVGGLSGWLIAAGGAWKDAPVEGFSAWKFLRSPVVVTAWVCLLLPATHAWLLLALAGGGLSVLSIETYKTFLTGGRPPGKFLGKPVRVDLTRTRTTCLRTHSALFLLLANGLWFTLVLDVRWSGADRGPATSAATAVLASVLAILVAAAPVGVDLVRVGAGSRSAAGSAAATREPSVDGELRRKST